MQSDEMYDELARIPLCPGKSFVSNTMCDDFINLTTDTIPSAFWHNVLDEKTHLKNKHALKAIYNFSQNCMKRKKFERFISNNKSGDNDDVYIPSPGVPSHILDLSNDEIEKLLTSSSS